MIFTLKMDAFEAYKRYLALKSHFTTDRYDFFKYNGAVKAQRDKFETRNDKYFFHKLSKHKDLTNFLVALFVYGKQDMWIGDILRNEESDKMYREWLRVKESLSYVFRNDIDKFNDDLVSSFTVVDGQHPHALKLLLRQEIHIETFIIMNDIIRFSPVWNREISEQTIWPSVRQKCKKYSPFMDYNKDQFKKIVVDRFNVTL